MMTVSKPPKTAQQLKNHSDELELKSSINYMNQQVEKLATNLHWRVSAEPLQTIVGSGKPISMLLRSSDAVKKAYEKAGWNVQVSIKQHDNSNYVGVEFTIWPK